MQDLLLHALVPSARHTQILAILAGLTATPSPPPILERHHIFKPTHIPPPPSQQPIQTGASQDVDTGKRAVKEAPAAAKHLLKDLVEDMTIDADFSLRILTADSDDVEDAAKWTLQTADLPEPGTRGATSRRRDVVTLSLSDVEGIARNEDFTSVGQYLLEGRLFVYGNVVVRLQRCLTFKPWDAAPGTGMDDLKAEPLDRSGAWLLETRIRVADGAEREVLARGIEELGRVREVLEGVVELRIVDRLALDGRAR